MNDRYAPASYPFPAPAAPEWTALAACRETDPELFYPPKGGTAASAKRICRTCPVITECLEYGLSDRHGVYGGLTDRERRLLRRTA